MLVALDLAAAADRHHAAHRQQRRLRRGVDEHVDRAHRVADEMRRLDAQHLTEPRDVPDPHATAVVEVDDFRGSAEPQHVGGQHTVVRCQRRDVALPPEFRAQTELAAVQAARPDHLVLLRDSLWSGRRQGRSCGQPRSRRFPRRTGERRAVEGRRQSWLPHSSQIFADASSRCRRPSSSRLPSGVGHARSACPTERSCPSVPTAACRS